MQFSTIAGFPDYLVTDTGIVLSRKIRGSHSGRLGQWKAMKLKHRAGYPCVNLYREKNKPESFMVHILMARAFVGPCPEGQEVRHLNDVKTDNRLENLCYGTPADNYADSIRNGKACIGERQHMAVYTNEDIRLIRRLADGGMKTTAIARQMGMRRNYVYRIIRREIWKYVT